MTKTIDTLPTPTPFKERLLKFQTCCNGNIHINAAQKACAHKHTHIHTHAHTEQGNAKKQIDKPMEQVHFLSFTRVFSLNIFLAYSRIFETSQIGKTHHSSVPKSQRWAPNLESIRTGLVHWGWSKWSADHLPSWRSSKTPSLLLPRWFGFQSEPHLWTLRVGQIRINWTHSRNSVTKDKRHDIVCCIRFLFLTRVKLFHAFPVLF